MKFGIYNIKFVIKNQDIVKCNNCEKFFYEEINDERNSNSLEFIVQKNAILKVCPVCKSDHFLINIKLSDLNKD